MKKKIFKIALIIILIVISIVNILSEYEPGLKIFFELIFGFTIYMIYKCFLTILGIFDN